VGAAPIRADGARVAWASVRRFEAGARSSEPNAAQQFAPIREHVAVELGGGCLPLVCLSSHLAPPQLTKLLLDLGRGLNDYQ
jgi:hypothetical protein